MLGVDSLLQCAGVVGGGEGGRHLLLLSLYERLTGLVVKDLCAVVAARLLAMKLAAGRVDLRSIREAIVCLVRGRYKCLILTTNSHVTESHAVEYKSDELGCYW